MDKKEYLDDASGVLVDISDTVLDTLAENEILDVIPGVRIAVTLIKAGKGYGEERLKRRLIGFLIECSGINKLDAERFIQKYVQDEKKAGYRLLDGLYDLDSDDKARLVGRIYRYCILNRLSLDTFYRLMKIINECYFEDIVLLNKIDNSEFTNNGKTVPEEIIDSLFYHGMLKNMGFDGGGLTDDEPGGTVYIINYYGKIIRDALYELPTSDSLN